MAAKAPPPIDLHDGASADHFRHCCRRCCSIAPLAAAAAAAANRQARQQVKVWLRGTKVSGAALRARLIARPPPLDCYHLLDDEMLTEFACWPPPPLMSSRKELLV